MKKVSHILISRADSIGDVVLTLPLAKFLKEYFPDVRISFLGKNYTRAVVESCIYIDDFIDKDVFLENDNYSKISKPDCIIHALPVKALALRARQLQIPLRIGTTNRIYHWFTCNKLIKLSRKNSTLHEAQLNLKFLRAFNINRDFSLKEISDSYGLLKIKPLEETFLNFLDPQKYNLILHPKSQGNGREWGLQNFIELINLLDKKRFKIFISGVEKERPALQPLYNKAGNNITDIAGKMNLYQFISFINACDGLIASGTGPIHIAAALGKDALGIYPPIRPVDPRRWQPVGLRSSFFVLNKQCNECRDNPVSCKCMQLIKPSTVQERLNNVMEKEIEN